MRRAGLPQCPNAREVALTSFSINFKLFFFQVLSGCPTANFGLLSRRQSRSADVNHCVIHIGPGGHQQPRNEVGFLKPGRAPSGV